MERAPLPQFDYDPTPRGDRCENCGAGPEADLRFLILRGRTRYFGRTLCDFCAETVLEAFLGSDAVPASGSAPAA